MKRKKTLMMSPRCVLQPCWHSCSLREGCRAGPGVFPRPAIPGPGPGTPCSAQPASLSVPSLPTSPQPEGAQSALSLLCLPISVPNLWVSVAPPSLSLSALSCPPRALSSAPRSRPFPGPPAPQPALHLAPDPGSSGPGCSLSQETEGLLQLPGLGGCEGGVGPVPEFRHHWGRCPCVLFN